MNKIFEDVERIYNLKNKNGITIVALITTIVVMLILTSITIGAINGNLLDYTGKGKIKTEITELNSSLMKKLLISDNKNISGKINDILNIESPYNDRLKIENGELVYIASKWTEDEIEMLEEMGIGMGLYDFYKQNTEIYYIANSSTKTAKYSDLPNVGTLESFRDMANAGTFNYDEARLIEDIKLNEGKYTITDGHITFAEDAEEWTPINNKFKSTLDGQEHTISGIYIDTDSYYMGFVGSLHTSASIKNLGIKNSYIKGKSYIGAFVGDSSGTIENCFNEAEVYATTTCVGGIVGHNTNSGIIKNSYNNITINNLTTNVGGIAGLNNGTIENCWNNKDITGSGRSGGISGNVGSTGIVKNCYNLGAIARANETGGICGRNNGTIEKCYNDGPISSTSWGIGGICGQNDGTVKECFNKNTVISTSYNVGGIAGENTNSIINCYNLGDLTGTNNTKTGGIVGQNSNADKTPTVSNCYNTGTISSTKANIGLIIGTNGSTSTVTDCYSLTTNQNLFGSDESTTTARCAKKTQIEMQAQDNSFINLLNAGLSTNVWLVRANNYPKLSWEQ